MQFYPFVFVEYQNSCVCIDVKCLIVEGSAQSALVGFIKNVVDQEESILVALFVQHCEVLELLLRKSQQVSFFSLVANELMK